jgi:hypothetical protein
MLPTGLRADVGWNVSSSLYILELLISLRLILGSMSWSKLFMVALGPSSAISDSTVMGEATSCFCTGVAAFDCFLILGRVI